MALLQTTVPGAYVLESRKQSSQRKVGWSGGSTPPAPALTNESASAGPTVDQAAPAPAVDPQTISLIDNEQDIVISARKFHHAPGDPFERANAVSFKLTQKVDAAVIGPAARTFDRVTPKPIRQGARNFFKNFREPVVFAITFFN